MKRYPDPVMVLLVILNVYAVAIGVESLWVFLCALGVVAIMTIVAWIALRLNR